MHVPVFVFGQLPHVFVFEDPSRMVGLRDKEIAQVKRHHSQKNG